MMLPSFVTYSLSYPIELTRHCSNRCEYCPYPFTTRYPLVSFRRLKAAIRQAQLQGATMVDLLAGEDLEAIPEIKRTLAFYHLHSYMGYLIGAGELAYHPAKGEPIPARLDVGPLSADNWTQAKPHYQGAKLLLTTVDPAVTTNGALSHAPSQAPERRLQSIVDAGAAGFPLTSGVLIGIGESRISREKAIKVLAQVATKYGHIRSVLIQAFFPNPATPMADYPRVGLEDMIHAVSVARKFLPPLVRVQINALDWPEHLVQLIAAGASDLGDLNLRVLSGHGRDPQMELELLLQPLKEQGISSRVRSVQPYSRSASPVSVGTANASDSFQ